LYFLRKGVVGRERLRNESFPPGHADGGTRSEAENLQANVSDRSLPTNIGNSEQRSNNPVEEKARPQGDTFASPLPPSKFRKDQIDCFQRHTQGQVRSNSSEAATARRPDQLFSLRSLRSFAANLLGCEAALV